MAGGEPGADAPEQKKSSDASNQNPPGHVPERRGSATAQGGRRAADRRGSAAAPGGDKPGSSDANDDDDDDGDSDDDTDDDGDDGDGDTDDDGKSGKSEKSEKSDPDKKPPRHVPERRGSVGGPGGRRAGDSRDGGADEGKGGGGDDDGEDDDKKDKPSPLKKTWVKVLIAVVVILLLVALIVWLWYYFTRGRYQQSTDDAYVKADKVVVTASVNAIVKRIAIVDNQLVSAGDLLLELDIRNSAAQVRQYAAQGAQSRAEAEQYRSQMREEQATAAAYAAQARGAEVQRGYYAGEVRRYQALVAAGAETDEKLAQLAGQRDQAAETVRQYRDEELSTRRKIETLRTQVAQADAKVDQAVAQQQQAAVDVDNSIVRAAVDGRVGDRKVFLGSYVTTGTQMMTLVPVGAIYVEANFKETQLGLMRIGQPVTIKVDALGGARIWGTVESFQPATGAEFSLLPPQNATGNFTKIVQRVPVRIRIDDAGPDARKVLVPGLSVVASVDTVGDKADVDRRKQEEKDRKEREQREHDRAVERDRSGSAPGPGR